MAGEQRMQQLLRSLRDPVVGTVVIYGIGGIGKTWMAKQAFNQAMASHLFDVFIWVPLSITCGIRHAREKISEKLSIPTGDGGDEGTRGKIHAFLSVRKFLLVLDDAWFTEEDVLDLMGVPRPSQGNASKVIVTTRNRRAQSVMLPDVVIVANLLTKTESWDLFCDRSGGGIPSQLALTVLNKCGCIPLSIILIAGALRDVSGASAMEYALKSASLALGNHAPTENHAPTDYTVMHRAARFGYSMLPSDAVKHCLFYCMLFPGNISIHVHCLILHWLTEGLLDESKCWDDAYAKGQYILMVLLDHGMLYKEDDGLVRMHDVVREVAFDIGHGKGFYRRVHLKQVDKPPAGTVLGRPAEAVSFFWGRYERISLMDETLEDLPGSLEFFRTSALLLTGIPFLKVIPNAFFCHVQILRVLDLSFTRIKWLPSSISDLVKLRLLLLKGCESLEVLQHISSLKNLEVLDVSGSTALRKILSSFEHMSSLRVLNISGSPIEFLPSLSGLKELRQLLLSGCRCLRSMLHLEELSKLELLDLSNTTLVSFPSGVSKLTALKYLNLAGVEYTTAGSYIPIESLGNDSKVWLSVSNAKFRTLGKDSPLGGNCFQKFLLCVSSLEEENIDNNVLFRMKQIFSETYFKTRHFAHSVDPNWYLEIHSIDNYPVGVEGILSHAELVSFNNVMFMKRLSDMGLGNMIAMRECWIERCNRVESVFSGEEVELIATIGSLENLWISNLENLRFVCGGMERVMSFDCLRHLHLDCCRNLVSLFASALHLQHLETLHIRFCDQLESVFEDSVPGEDVLPRLHTLQLWELPELKSICGGVLPSLKNIKVKECPKLKKLPVGVTDMTPIVIITGDKSWWNNLVIEDERIRPYLLFRRLGRF